MEVWWEFLILPNLREDGLPQEQTALLEHKTLPTETILGAVRAVLGAVRAGSREKRHLRWMTRTPEKKANTSLGSWKSIIKAEDGGESALLFTKIKDQTPWSSGLFKSMYFVSLKPNVLQSQK